MADDPCIKNDAPGLERRVRSVSEAVGLGAPARMDEVVHGLEQERRDAQGEDHDEPREVGAFRVAQAIERGKDGDESEPDCDDGNEVSVVRTALFHRSSTSLLEGPSRESKWNASFRQELRPIPGLEQFLLAVYSIDC